MDLDLKCYYILEVKNSYLAHQQSIRNPIKTGFMFRNIPFKIVLCVFKLKQCIYLSFEKHALIRLLKIIRFLNSIDLIHIIELNSEKRNSFHSKLKYYKIIFYEKL